jgi:DNA-binding NtrC family response regulator
MNGEKKKSGGDHKTPAGPKILVVEQMESARAFLRGTMAPDILNAVILEARDGWTALKMLQKEPVDLVILDLEAPFSDRAGILSHIREKTADKPLIVLADQVNAELLIGYKADPLVWFIQKPSTASEIHSLVKHLLGL